jgi:hypothetical protein
VVFLCLKPQYVVFQKVAQKTVVKTYQNCCQSFI